MIEKIKLDLFKLKSKKDLESIYHFFKKSTGKWFNDNKSPKDEFFHIKKCLQYQHDHFCDVANA